MASPTCIPKQGSRVRPQAVSPESQRPPGRSFLTHVVNLGELTSERSYFACEKLGARFDFLKA